MKYRRSRTLILYWHDGDLTVENYLEPKPSDVETDNALAVDPGALALLDAFEDWNDADSVAAAVPDHDPASVAEAVDALAEAGLLATEEEAEREDRFLRAWANWGEEARFFHFATKNAVFTSDSEEQRAADARWVVEQGGPAPPIFKSYPDAPRLHLPRTFVPLDEAYGSVLTRRRTHRHFTGEPVSLQAFSTLLHLCFAPMKLYDGGELGTLMLRTSPCGGARHEVEPYLAVMDVADVPPGLYHYNVEAHALELLDPGFDRGTLEGLTFEHTMALPSAFVCFLTGVFIRTMWKYHHSRAYRVTLLNCGHLGQTFALTCTALGIGPWQTAAFRDDRVEAALGVDGFSESALYMLGGGMPTPMHDGVPEGITLAQLVDPGALTAAATSPQAGRREA